MVIGAIRGAPIDSNNSKARIAILWVILVDILVVFSLGAMEYFIS